MLRVLFHLIVFGINSFVLWYDQMYVVLPMPVKEMEDLPLKSRSMFLTMWCLMLQTIYHFIAFLNDIIGSNAKSPKKPPFIRQIKDTLFTLAFATAVYVSFAFWSLYIIDKDLIFPEIIEKSYPIGFNHVMHTTVSVFIIIELLTSYRNYPSRKIGFSITLMFCICYLIWFFTIYAKTGAWVYPVFKHLNWPLRIVFVVLSLVVAIGFYMFGEKLNKFVYSNQKELHVKRVKSGAANGTKKRS